MEKITEVFNLEAKIIINKYKGKYIKSTGDGMLATFSGPSSAIICAFHINSYLESQTDLNLKLRSGLHTGEIEIIGEDISGISVNLASRIQSSANPNEVVVSDMLKMLAFGSSIKFENKGEYEFKGFENKWPVSKVLSI